MRSLAHSYGVNRALYAYGAYKQSSFIEDVVREIKRQAIGDPKKTWAQIRDNKLFHPTRGLLADAFPKTVGDAAAALAMPAFGTYLIAKNSPELGVGEVAGDLTARSIGAMVGQPLLGAVGQIGGGMLLAPVGRAVGKLFDRKKEDERVEFAP